MLTRQQCRQADWNAIHHYQIPGLILMENAGRNCVDQLLQFDDVTNRSNGAIVILCGPGNNGGDGFVIARHLSNAGFIVKVILFAAPEKYSGDALVNLRAIERLDVSIIEFNRTWPKERIREVFAHVNDRPATWVVDALLGTGAIGEPRSTMESAIEVANSLPAHRMAIDIPTGLDCDTGIPAAMVFDADLTCTFIATKIGFSNPAAKSCLGKLVVVDIGAPPDIVDANLRS